MGKIFCVEFQRYPLKLRTKYLTQALKDMILYNMEILRAHKFKSPCAFFKRPLVSKRCFMTCREEWATRELVVGFVTKSPDICQDWRTRPAPPRRGHPAWDGNVFVLFQITHTQCSTCFWLLGQCMSYRQQHNPPFLSLSPPISLPYSHIITSHTKLT